MQLTAQNSVQYNTNCKISRIYISTPLSSKPEVKPIQKKLNEAKEKLKKCSYSIVNWTEFKSMNELEQTSMTIYNYNLNTIFPKIREVETNNHLKQHVRSIDKKRYSGNYIPPKILRFHPYIGLKPEAIHVIGKSK